MSTPAQRRERWLRLQAELSHILADHEEELWPEERRTMRQALEACQRRLRT